MTSPALRTQLAALPQWYRRHARDLPWRGDGRTPWGVFVSEIMLQQTPVARVLPVWRSWLDRWPSPTDLAADSPGEAIREWGRLGYPRRALRLHAAAVHMRERCGGDVPGTYVLLRELPGVGDYTAAAVAGFAFGERRAVLDVNVRRVLARAVSGVAGVPAAPTRAERTLAESVLPEDGPAAASWSQAVMELGALVCTARGPDCGSCPLVAKCAWRRAGYPADDPARPSQSWQGSDRQARGRLMAALRDARAPIERVTLDQLWPDAAQRERALTGLVADGLVEVSDAGYRLPS